MPPRGGYLGMRIGGGVRGKKKEEKRETDIQTVRQREWERGRARVRDREGDKDKMRTLLDMVYVSGSASPAATDRPAHGRCCYGAACVRLVRFLRRRCLDVMICMRPSSP